MTPDNYTAVLSWNICPTYKTDIPYQKQKVIKEISKHLSTKKTVRIFPKKVLPFNSYTYPQLIETLEKNFNRRTLYIGEKKFPLRKKKCDKVESENYRKEDLWRNRKQYVIKTLKHFASDTKNIPSVILLQGTTIEQLRDIQQSFSKKKWICVSYSSKTGDESLEIPKHDTQGVHITILFKKGAWIPVYTDTTYLSGPKEKIKRLLLGIRALNLYTNEFECFFNTQFGTDLAKHPDYIKKTNAFIEKVTEGNIPYVLGGTFKLYQEEGGDELYPLLAKGKNDHRNAEEFYSHNQGTYAGFPFDPYKADFFNSNLEEKVHDLLLSNQHIIGASTTPIAYNPETKKLTTSPDRQRYFASDHFPLTMITTKDDL